MTIVKIKPADLRSRPPNRFHQIFPNMQTMCDILSNHKTALALSTVYHLRCVDTAYFTSTITEDRRGASRIANFSPRENI